MNKCTYFWLALGLVACRSGIPSESSTPQARKTTECDFKTKVEHRNSEVESLPRLTRDVVWSTDVVIGHFVRVESPEKFLHFGVRSIWIEIDEVLGGDLVAGRKMEVEEGMFPVPPERLRARLSSTRFALFLHPSVNGVELSSEFEAPSPTQLEELRQLIKSRDSLPQALWAKNRFEQIAKQRECLSDHP